MVDDLLIEVIRELAHEADGHGLNLGGLQRWKRPQNLVWAVIVVLRDNAYTIVKADIPWAGEKLIPD